MSRLIYFNVALICALCVVRGDIFEINTTLTCQGDQTPDDCNCLQDKIYKTYIDCVCSNKTWTFVHKELPYKLETLDLGHNSLTRLRNDSFFGCYKVNKLYLNHNNIMWIEDGTFEQLKGLHILDLQYNQLKFDDQSSVPKFMLQHNRGLQQLYINNNCWYKETEYGSHLLYKMYTLKDLHMDGIPGAIFDTNFKYLRNLRHLWLLGGIKEITNDTFRNFTGLKYLTQVVLNGGGVVHIDALAFSHFQNLTELNLADNNALSFEGIKAMTYGLRFTRINRLKLTHINTKETSIDEDFYSQFRNLTYLKEIHLSTNTIVKIDFKNICKHLRILDTLNLNMNMVTWVDNVGDLSKCLDFAHIYAQRQTNQYETERFSTNYITLPQNMKVINLRNAFKIHELDKLYVQGGLRLEHINLAKNEIVRLEGPIRFTDQCNPNKSLGITLDLGGNGMNYIKYNSIDKTIAKCIKILILSNNELAQAIAELTGNFFLHYDRLQLLELSTNKITNIQADLFIHLRSLKILRLRNNRLQALVNLNGLSLSFLHLALNNINFFRKEECDELNKANSLHPLRVDLQRNPFVCTCESYPFLQWLNNTTTNVTRWEHNTCGSQIVNKETLQNNILPHLYFQCHIKIWLIIGGGTLATALCLSLLVIYVYRKRWCLKYWCIKAIRNRKRHQLLLEHDARELYKYDAFVMYSADDSSWVAHQLVPNLEPDDTTESDSENHFKLCIHHRDFLGGVDISENIVEAIDSSFKCLVVLSRKFCQSEWTTFELQMARSRSKAEGRNVIIVIRLEEVPLREMSTSLIYILRNHTYIDYPKSAEALPAFWEKVKNALRESC